MALIQKRPRRWSTSSLSSAAPRRGLVPGGLFQSFQNPLNRSGVAASRRQFNKKRSGSWMCGNGRSVKTRHQKWTSETGGRHDASIARFAHRDQPISAKPRGTARFLSNLHMCRVGDGLAGWGHETRTTESVRIEIRLSCRENFARFGQKRVQRRFPM
jgi:ribosomal protein L37E